MPLLLRYPGEIALDREELVAVVEPLMCCGVASLFRHGREHRKSVEEVAACMRHASNQYYTGQLLIDLISVHMQVAAEAVQELARMLGCARLLVIVEHDRRPVAPAAIQPHVGGRLRFASLDR